jgi:hypothetical protein
MRQASSPGPSRNKTQVAAILTARPPGLADPAAVEDQYIAHLQPAVTRVDPHQRPLDLDRVVLQGQPQPPGHPPHVGVDRDPVSPAEGVGRHHGGGLSTDAVQRDQLVERRRHLAAVARDDGRTGLLDRPRLVAEEPGRPDHLL